MVATAEFNMTDREFREVSELVYRTCGITLHDGKKDLVRARLSKRMRALEIDSITEYLRVVHGDATGREMTTFIDLLSTNLTSFFRENAHFDFLTRRVVPGLVESKRGSRRIRAWSAGCSSGEEAYSLAMTLLESLKNAGEWDVRILATDISTRVLATAREGVYSAAKVATVPPLIKSTYFAPLGQPDSAPVMLGRTRRSIWHSGPGHDPSWNTAQDDNLPPSDNRYQLLPRARDLIAFRRLNLMEAWPFSGPFDFIFCRNVMIYFDKPTQQKLVGRYFDCLAPGGFLFTGHSESLAGISHRFRYVEPTIYIKP